MATKNRKHKSSPPIQKQQRYFGLHHQTRKCLKANLQCDDTELNKIHEILVDLNKFNDKTKKIASTMKSCLTPKDFENMCSKSRKFAEAVCSEYGIKSVNSKPNLNNDIEQLKKREKTTPTHTLHFLRKKGNKAVHYNSKENDEKSPDNKTEIMRQIVSSINIVAEWFYIVMKKKQFDDQLNYLLLLDQKM
eukprot:208949_1